MTQPVTPWLPGQAPVAGANYGHLALPGISDGAAPYGMDPNRRHVIPDQVNLDGPVKPDDITLDDSPGPAKLAGGPLLPQPAAPSAPQGPATGWRVKNAHGQVVATIGANPRAGLDYQKLQVQNIGDSLLKQAVTPEETEAAQRATAFGLSLVGSMANDKIQAAIVHRYDEDIGNATKVHLQDMRTRNRGGGKGGPVGPSKADKFDDQTNKEDAEFEEKIVNNEETKNKLAAMGEMQRDLDRMDQLMASGRGLQERVAQQEELKQLTGKVSRESEQLVITGGAGIWNNLANRLSLYTSENPSLTAAYTQEFRKMIATSRNKLKEQRAAMGESAGQRLINSERFVNADQKAKERLKRYGRGAITGEWPSDAPAPGVDADLVK